MVIGVTDGYEKRLEIQGVGYRAQLKYQSGATTQYQQVLIGNSSFRIGDSKFVLTGTGKATVANAVTDPVTGNTSLVQGNATLGT